MIREARTADTEALSAVFMDSIGGSHDLAAISDQISSSTGIVIVYTAGAQIIGGILGNCSGAEAEIYDVAVLSTARRAGHGTRLVTAFIAACSKRGAEEVFLEVRESNEAARALYTQQGFTPVGRRKGYYSNGEDALVLRWSPQ